MNGAAIAMSLAVLATGAPTAREGNSPLPSWQAVAVGNSGISVRLPPRWTVESAAATRKRNDGSIFVADAPRGYGELSVARTDPTRLTFANEARAWLNLIRSHHKTILTSHLGRLGGVRAMAVTAKWRYGSDMVFDQEYLFSRHAKIYVVLYRCWFDERSHWAPLFARSAASVRFTK
jgi:hypothetical protein